MSALDEGSSMEFLSSLGKSRVFTSLFMMVIVGCALTAIRLKSSGWSKSSTIGLHSLFPGSLGSSMDAVFLFGFGGIWDDAVAGVGTSGVRSVC